MPPRSYHAPIRFGIVGMGNMGKGHADQIKDLLEKEPTTPIRLAAVCDARPDFLKQAVEKYAAMGFADYDQMLASGQIDAVIIAAPHFAHPDMAIAAFKAGVAVLCEKPMAVCVTGADAMQQAAQQAGLAFGMVFQNRLNRQTIALRQLLQQGRTGRLLRVTYTRTDWLRTRAYYQSSDWRATWKGEGGGILMNQAPHDLDLLAYLVGKPVRVAAFCRTLRHNIEVEDFAAGLIEFADGAVGFFQSTTAESPGRNQLEIVGDRGTVLLEHGKVYFSEVLGEVTDDTPEPGPSDTMTLINKSAQSFPRIRRSEAQEVPMPVGGGKHVEMVVNLARHMLEGEPLVAPGSEGHWATELANAFYLSSQSGQPVDLPVSREAATAFFRQKGSPI